MLGEHMAKLVAPMCTAHWNGKSQGSRSEVSVPPNPHESETSYIWIRIVVFSTQSHAIKPCCWNPLMSLPFAHVKTLQTKVKCWV